MTLGFGEIIEIVANNLNGVTGGPAGTPGLIPQFSVHFFGISVNYTWTGTVLPYYYLILGVAVVFMVAFSFLEQSRVGRSWTAIREDEVAADSMGINALKYKVMAFAIGASTAGFAGVFFASQVQSLVSERLHRPDFDSDSRVRDLRRDGVDRGCGRRRLLHPVASAVPQIHSFRDYQFQDEFIYLGALLIITDDLPAAGHHPLAPAPPGDIAHRGGRHWTPRGPVQVRSCGEVCRRSYGKLSLDEPGYIGPGDGMTDDARAGRAGSTDSPDLVFSVEHVTLRFGGVTSLNDVSLKLHRGELLSVIGPNGAGKTSLFNCLTGVYRPQEGSILFTARTAAPSASSGASPTR